MLNVLLGAFDPYLLGLLYPYSKTDFGLPMAVLNPLVILNDSDF